MIKRVSTLVLEKVAVFEFGVICEVFGIDRSEDGVPRFDFRVCGPQAGRRYERRSARPSLPITVWTR